MNNWFQDSGILGSTSPDGTQTPGWGNLALGGAQALIGGYMGLQQLKLAKDSLNQSKKEFKLNYNAQVDTTNRQLADRQAARYASNPDAYQSPSEYMQQYQMERTG